MVEPIDPIPDPPPYVRPEPIDLTVRPTRTPQVNKALRAEGISYMLIWSHYHKRCRFIPIGLNTPRLRDHEIRVSSLSVYTVKEWIEKCRKLMEDR